MNKNQDFAQCLYRFFNSYLSRNRNVSQNTLMAYTHSFSLFFQYMKSKQSILPHKMRFQDFSVENIQGFLDWLEYERHCSISTRNQRLGAIHSFCRFIEIDHPEYLANIRSILLLKYKKAPKPEMNYLSHDGIKLLLLQPDTRNEHEFRDLMILTLLYDIAARVSELVEIKKQDLFLQNPASVRLHGKGDKYRQVPLMPQTVSMLKQYLIVRNRFQEPTDYLFLNPSGRQLSRGGITYILQKYGDRARNVDPTQIPKRLSPHCLRHSKAMHLLQSGVNLIYIRDFIGHSDIKTTEIYARADPEMKRSALEKAYAQTAPPVASTWCYDDELVEWLKQFD